MIDDPDLTELLDRVRSGDRAALSEALAHYREGMRRFIEARLEQSLRARIDPSDVVQEAFLEVSNRAEEFLERNVMPFPVWLQITTYQTLLRLRRHHGAGCRATNLEAPRDEEFAVDLLRTAFVSDRGPLEQVLDSEIARRVNESLAKLPEADRQLLRWRIHEARSNGEIAAILHVDPKTVSKRYVRALSRLREELLGHDSDPE